MKKKIFVWCDFKKVTFELKLYFARPFATQRFYNCKIHSDFLENLRLKSMLMTDDEDEICWWQVEDIGDIKLVAKIK